MFVFYLFSPGWVFSCFIFVCLPSTPMEKSTRRLIEWRSRWWNILQLVEENYEKQNFRSKLQLCVNHCPTLNSSGAHITKDCRGQNFKQLTAKIYSPFGKENEKNFQFYVHEKMFLPLTISGAFSIEAHFERKQKY